MKEFLVVIGKFPSKGHSKTRLAADLGEDAALDLYRAFIEDFFTRYKAIIPDIKLFFWGTPATQETQDYFEDVFHKLGIAAIYQHQPEQDFFKRLRYIFTAINREYGESFIHLTGTDIPDFPFSKIKDASKDKVNLGPDNDGGFYYLGAKSSCRDIFELGDVIDGGVNVFESIKQRSLKLGHLVKLITPWSDVDTAEDLLRTMQRDVQEKLNETKKIVKQYQLFK